MTLALIIVATLCALNAVGVFVVWWCRTANDRRARRETQMLQRYLDEGRA